MKKNINNLTVFIQLILSLGVLVVGVLSIIKSSFISYFEIVLGLDLFIMAYNNHIMYKRKYFTLVYIVGAIMMIVLGILRILGV